VQAASPRLVNAIGVYWLPAAESVWPSATVSCAVAQAVEPAVDADVLALAVSLGPAVGDALDALAEPAGLLEVADAAELGLLPPLQPASSTTSAAAEVSKDAVRRTVTR